MLATEANVDGTFPGRESKPTPETLADFREFVAEADADFGFGHDGDADRIVVVDADGDVVHEDTYSRCSPNTTRVLRTFRTLWS